MSNDNDEELHYDLASVYSGAKILTGLTTRIMDLIDTEAISRAIKVLQEEIAA